MKVFSKTLLVACTLAQAPFAFGDDPVPSPLVSVSANTVFVPVGFDDNDQAVAVLDGYLPDTCYRLAFNKTTYDAATKTFKVTQWARKFPGVCLEMRVPFFTAAALGAVPSGDYKVKVRGADEETMVVAEASSAGPDDFFYAPIDSVRVEKVDGRYVGVLEGRFGNSCMIWDEIRVLNHNKTIEVLPIVKMNDDGSTCEDGEFQFTKRVALPDGLPVGRHLMHVRSLNGQSANMVYTVAE